MAFGKSGMFGEMSLSSIIARRTCEGQTYLKRDTMVRIKIRIQLSDIIVVIVIYSI